MFDLDLDLTPDLTKSDQDQDQDQDLARPADLDLDPMFDPKCSIGRRYAPTVTKCTQSRTGYLGS